VWRARDLWLTLSVRDVKVKYRQTALGATWVVLQPLLGAGIFSFVFGRVAKLPSGGVPYFVFSFAGLLGWNVFNSTVTTVSESLVSNSSLVSKIFFPRLILPLTSALATTINFVVSLTMMAILWWYYLGTFSGLRLLALPAWFLLVLTLALGIGLFAAAVMVTYRDVRQIIPAGLNLALYISPVAYSTAAVPHSLRTIYALNPLVGILDGFRWSLVAHATMEPTRALYAFGVAIVLLVAGAVAFARMERKFADVV
jgi:lipopolysaccharide transport system permease protein